MFPTFLKHPSHNSHCAALQRQIFPTKKSGLEKAKHQNLLVVLPPQMGKTLLACQLAEWYRGQDQLVAYTAPSVELCNQAARCLARQLPQAAVATVTGECRWEKEEWNKGCNGNLDDFRIF